MGYPTYVNKGATATISNDNSAHNVGAPASIVAGNLLILKGSMNDNVEFSATPTGWTPGGGDTLPQGSNGAVYFYWKLATAGDVGTANYSITLKSGGGRNSTLFIEQWTTVHQTTPINGFTVGSRQSATTTPTSPAVTSSVDSCSYTLLLTEYNQHNVTMSAGPSGYTLNLATGANPSIGSAYKENVGVAGAYTPGTWTSPASQTFEVMTIAIAPPPPPSAALTGTAAAGGFTEANVVSGGKTIILTLTNDTWVASGATFNAERQNIINGLDSAQAEAAGWDAVVKATQGIAGVVRTSATVVTITLDAFASYSITANEVITATIPSTAVTSAGAIVASPTFTVLDGTTVNYSLTCAAGSYGLTGQASSTAAGVAYNLTQAAGSYGVTGVAATLTYTPGGGGARNYTLACNPGSYGVIGRSIDMVWSGARTKVGGDDVPERIEIWNYRQAKKPPKLAEKNAIEKAATKVAKQKPSPILAMLAAPEVVVEPRADGSFEVLREFELMRQRHLENDDLLLMM